MVSAACSRAAKNGSYAAVRTASRMNTSTVLPAAAAASSTWSCSAAVSGTVKVWAWATSMPGPYQRPGGRQGPSRGDLGGEPGLGGRLECLALREERTAHRLPPGRHQALHRGA